MYLMSENYIMKKEKLSILVVEDDDFYATLIIDYLKEKDYVDIRYARTGVECLLEVFEVRIPQVVILDYHLVNLDGIKIMERLLNYCKDLKVIIISNQEDLKVAIQAMKMGASDYLVKNEKLFQKLSDKVDQININQSESGFKTKVKNIIGQTWTIYNDTFLGASN